MSLPGGALLRESIEEQLARLNAEVARLECYGRAVGIACAALLMAVAAAISVFLVLAS